MESILKNLIFIKSLIIIILFSLSAFIKIISKNAIKLHIPVFIILFVLLLIHFIIVAWWGFSEEKNEMNYVMSSLFT